MNVHYLNQKTPGSRPEGARRAQAIVEFALVLPILMVMLVGIFEVGRLLFIYTAVTNASREAARFGSALGYDDDGYHKYKDCNGIRNMARKSAYFLNLTDANISISYDHGPSTSSFVVCDQATGEDPNVVVNSGTAQDRVLITITASYSPLIRLIPIGSRTITSSSARTILGFVDVGSAATSVGGGGATATSPAGPTATSTSTAAPTATDTATATATAPIIIATPTFLPSSTPTLIPTSTNTATPSATFTSTPTATGTSTPVASCSSITTGSLTYSGSTMSLTITNPYTAVTVSSIKVTWAATNGHQMGSDKTLKLLSANLGTTFWSGINDSTGSYTITPTSTLTIPGNNTSSTITFTFHQSYDNPKSTDSITINLSTAGCSAIHKP